MDSLILAINSYQISEDKSESFFDELIIEYEVVDNDDHLTEPDIIMVNYSCQHHRSFLIKD
jgi:hypothetical protein